MAIRDLPRSLLADCPDSPQSMSQFGTPEMVEQPTTFGTSNAPLNLQWKVQTREEMITAGLERIYGKGARVRSPSQLNAIKFVIENHPISVVIMPTGAGKSTVFTVPAAFREAKLTLVIVPFAALLEDMINRCQKLGLRTHQWSDKEQARGSLGTAEIVVAGTWTCTNDVFRTWVKKVSLDGWLDRIVIDEAHLLYTQAKFRAEMNELYWLRDCGCPLVLLTATLPPREQPLLESKLKIEEDSSIIKYFRLPTTRQNIHYSVIPFRNTKDCLQAVLDDIEREWETLQDPAARAIVYCRSIDDAERVGRQLKCGVYNSRLKSPAKKEVFSNWANGGPGICKFSSATSGLGVGIDIPSVRIVYHYRESQDFLGFVQESGRAGRDGLPAKSKVFLDTTSLTRLEKLEHAPSLGERAIFEYHINGFCRQAAISFYVDGTAAWCVNSKDSELIPCDLCQILNSQAKMVSRLRISHNSPRGNSSLTMRCRTNQSALLQGRSSSTNSQTPHQLASPSSPRGRSYHRIFDGPLAGLPENATGFRIPSHQPRCPAPNTALLASGSKPGAGQQHPQNRRTSLEEIDHGYLSSVHSSDAWLSPLVVDKERLTQPRPSQRRNADNPGSTHSSFADMTPTSQVALSLSQMVRRQEAMERDSVNQCLELLQNSCVLCWYKGKDEDHVGLMECPLMCETITEYVYREFKRGLQFERFSCCYRCLMPLQICRPGSTRVTDCSGRFKEILLPLLLFLFKSPSEHPRLAQHIGLENMADPTSLKRWASRKVRWNCLQCSNLWLLFVSLVQDRN